MGGEKRGDGGTGYEGLHVDERREREKGDACGGERRRSVRGERRRKREGRRKGSVRGERRKSVRGERSGSVKGERREA